jgi:hypothetical protein
MASLSLSLSLLLYYYNIEAIFSPCHPQGALTKPLSPKKKKNLPRAYLKLKGPSPGLKGKREQASKQASERTNE